MRTRKHTLAVMVALALGVTAPALADTPPNHVRQGHSRDHGVRNANMGGRRARRRRRRQERRANWAEIERQRQATERQRLATQQAQAEADRAAAEAEAERIHHSGGYVQGGYVQGGYVQGGPVIVGAQPIVVTQMGFNVNQVQAQAVALTPGFMPDPYAMRGRAAGRISSAQLGLPAGCPGFWTNNPQHVVSLPQGMNYFRVDVVSNADTTLAIVTPDGQVWCDDDGGDGQNPRLEGQFPAGTYAVYVGTYRRGRRARYTAHFSERAVQTQVQQVQVQVQPQATVIVQGQQATVYPQVTVHRHDTQAYPQQVQQPPVCRTELLQRGHHAANLQHCQGAEPYCAAALLQAGHHPANLVHCQGVAPQCAVTLLGQGHHPANLVHCQGAEPTCAMQVLQSGQHPANLVHCR